MKKQYLLYIYLYYISFLFIDYVFYIPSLISLYYSYYILSIDDLKHLTAVRSVQHNKFAEENGLASFMMSAKNGDQVNQAFWKIASNLAGKFILHLLKK